MQLSSRYYAAETSVWLLGAVLFVCRFIGIAPGQALPILNVVPGDERLFPRIVGLLIVAAAAYMIVEWKQSSREARSLFWLRARIAATLLWTIASLWLSWSLIVMHSPFEGVSPAWYLTFIVIGFLVGTLTSTLAFSALMIRNQSEAKRLCLPRVPAATRAQFFTWAPVILLLTTVYGVLLYLSPPAVKLVAVPLFVVPFLAMLGELLGILTLARDSDGNRIPFAKRVASFKEIYDFHDYAYTMIDHGEEYAKELGIPSNSTSQNIQRAMQERFAKKGSEESMHFKVQQQEETQFLFYPKDGNPENLNPENRGVKISKSGSKKGLLRILVIPDAEWEARQMEISVALVESCAENYIRMHTKQENLTFGKIFSHAINQAVIKAMMDQAEPQLYAAAYAGQIDVVRQLVQHHNIDVNQKASYGWTALLAAAAQGYPEVARLLLEAGANPDIGNVHGITPLMYGARYGNAEICSILVEYGAAIDQQDVYGMTALIIASRDGHHAIVSLLIEEEADTNVTTRQGMTALDFAHACKHGKITKTLRKANKELKATR